MGLQGYIDSIIRNCDLIAEYLARHMGQPPSKEFRDISTDELLEMTERNRSTSDEGPLPHKVIRLRSHDSAARFESREATNVIPFRMRVEGADPTG